MRTAMVVVQPPLCRQMPRFRQAHKQFRVLIAQPAVEALRAAGFPLPDLQPLHRTSHALAHGQQRLGLPQLGDDVIGRMTLSFARIH